MRSRFPALFAVSGPTVGFLAVGLSGFVLLAAGPRLLGLTQYALLAVAWTLTNAIGVGLAQPGEQAVSRATAIRAPGGVASRVRRRLLLVTAAVLLLPLAGWLGLDPVLGGSQLWAWSIVLAALGWALAAPVRGVLAGGGQFGAYAWSLAAEAVVRVLLVATAWLGVGASDVWLAASLGVPLFVSALVARALDRRSRNGDTLESSPERIGSDRDQLWYTAVAFSIQVSLALPAVVLQAFDPTSGVAGAFVTASVYMRIPIMLIGGLAVVVLSQVATYFGSARYRQAAKVAWKSLVAALAIGVVGVSVLLLGSDLALRLLYGQELELPQALLIVLGAATVAAMVVGVLTQSLFGCGLARPAAFVWIAVGLVVAGASVILPHTPTAMAGVVLLGQLFALLASGPLLLAVFRSKQDEERAHAD